MGGVRGEDCGGLKEEDWVDWREETEGLRGEDWGD